MPRLIDIALHEVDRSGQVATTYDLLHAFQQIVIRRAVGDAEELSLTFVASGHPDAPRFTRRRVVVTEYDDGAEELWRVLRSGGPLDGTGPITVECQPLWLDLDAHSAALTLSSGQVVTGVTITGVTAQAALDRILSASYGCPALFEAGDVHASIADREVFIAAENVSFLELIRLLAEQLDNAEWYCTWTGEAYQVHVTPHIGDASAVNRLIANDGDVLNLPEVRKESDASDYFSSVRPVGGGEGEAFTIARAVWPVTSAVWNSGTGRTTLTLGGEPVWASAVLVGRKFAGFTIYSTTKPGTVVVTGNASALTKGTFTKADGSDLVELTDDAAVAEMGVQVRRERFGGAVPAPNLLADSGISCDLSAWPTSSSVTGWSAVGGATLAKDSDPLNVRYGTFSAKVTAAAAGAGIQSALVDWDPTTISQVVSARVHARILQGGIKLEIVDAAGNVYPADAVADSSAETFEGIGIGGEQPPAGQLRLRLVATEANTIFVLDAATLTPSGSPYDFAPHMGGRALWKDAALLLARDGGVTPDGYDGLVVELNSIDPAFEAIGIGDQVQAVIATVDPFETRVVAVEEEIVPEQQVYHKRFTLSRLKADFRRRFRSRPDVPKPTTRQPRSIILPTITREYYQQGSTLYARLTPHDPSGLIQSFEYATAVGTNLPDGVAYTPKAAEGDGSYLVSAAIVGKHNSTIGWRFILKGPHAPIGDIYTGDADLIPKASYEVKYRYDAFYGGVIATLVCRGDEDTGSFVITWEHGSDVYTQTVNGRTANVDLNPGYPMATGDDFSVTATAYRQASGGGTAEAQPHDVSYEVPALANSTAVTMEELVLSDGLIRAKRSPGPDALMLWSETVDRWGAQLDGGSFYPFALLDGSLQNNLNAEYLGGYGASAFPRKAENAAVSGLWSFSQNPSIAGGTNWYSGNDGAGSGLDADLLDGQHGSYYAALSETETITGLWTVSRDNATFVFDAPSTDGRVEFARGGVRQGTVSYATDVLHLKADFGKTLKVGGTSRGELVFDPSSGGSFNYNGATHTTVDTSGQWSFINTLFAARIGAYTAGELILDARNQGSSGNHVDVLLGGWSLDYFRVLTSGGGNEVFRASWGSGGLFGGSGAANHTTYDASGFWTYGKPVTINTGASSAYLYVDGGSANSSGVHFRNGSSDRWLWYRNGADSDNLWLHGYGPNTGLLKFAYSTGEATATKPWTFQDEVSLYRVASDLLPASSYQYNIGAIDNKWLSLFAAELRVETIVSDERRVTAGGRLTVGYSSILHTSLPVGSTTLDVKHNSFTAGDVLHFEKEGQVEFVNISSYVGSFVDAEGTTYYRYSVNRNLDGTGQNEWQAGDSTFNTKQAGAGFLDLTALYSLTDTTRANAAGPALTVWQRTGTTYNAISERTVLGNLRGKYNYSTSVDAWGFAAGDPAAGNITVDPTNGVRFRAGSTTVGYINATDLSIAGGRFAYNSGTDTATLSGWTATSTALTNSNIAFAVSGLSSYFVNNSLTIGYDGSEPKVRLQGLDGEVIGFTINSSYGAYLFSYDPSLNMRTLVGSLDQYFTGQHGFLLRRQSSGDNLFYVTDTTAYAFGWTADTTKLYNASGGGIYLNATSTRITLGGDAAYSSMSAGIFLGLESSVPKFRLKDKLTFDGTNLAINGSGTFSGNVTATTLTATVSGQIGPWALSSTALSYSSGSVQAAMNMSTHGSIHVQYNDGTGDWLRASMGQGYWSSSLRDFYGFSVGWQGTSANSGLPYFAAGMPTGSGGLTFHGDTAAQYTPFLHIGGSSAYMWFSGSTLKIAGELVAASGTFAGLVDAGGIKVGLNVNGSADGIYLDSNNYWYVSADLRVGSASKYLLYDRSAGTLTYTGALSAATGTFAGSLSAATGTFAGALSAATGTFSGSLSAATGTFSGSLSAATGTFSGALSAASGTFAGLVDAGGIKVGLNVNGSADGIYLDSNNFWYVSDDLRVGSASKYLLYDRSAGTLTYTGALSAATGTFAGSLSAATGTFAGSLSAATGSFSGSVTASSGSITGNLLMGASGKIATATSDYELTDNGLHIFDNTSSTYSNKRALSFHSTNNYAAGGRIWRYQGLGLTIEDASSDVRVISQIGRLVLDSYLEATIQSDTQYVQLRANTYVNLTSSNNVHLYWQPEGAIDIPNLASATAAAWASSGRMKMYAYNYNLYMVDNAGNYYSSQRSAVSDRRLKLVKGRTTERVLPKLARLGVYDYEWTEEAIQSGMVQSLHPRARQVGPLAQELEQLFPGVVHDPGSGYLHWDQREMAPVFILAHQEHYETTEDLKRRVISLEAEVQRLRMAA